MNRTRWACLVGIAITAVATGNACMAAHKIELRRIDVSQAAADYPLAMRRASGPDAIRALHASLVPLEAGSDLKLLRTMKGPRGTTYRYEQVHRGVPVFGEQVIVNENRLGGLESLWGRLTQGLERDVPETRPQVPRQRAIEIAERAWISGRGPEGKLGEGEVRLVIHAEEAEKAVLAYVVIFLVRPEHGHGPAEPTVVIDAISGEVLSMWDGLPTAT